MHYERVVKDYASCSNGFKDDSSQLIRNSCSDSTLRIAFVETSVKETSFTGSTVVLIFLEKSEEGTHYT